MAITGTATRFSSGPAIVTRENTTADSGISASSVATDAASDVVSHRRTVWAVVAAAVGPAPMRPATSINAAVAPNVSRNPTSRTSSGSHTTITDAATAVV